MQFVYHVQGQLMLEEHVGRRTLSSLHAIPEIRIKANPLNGVILEGINHEIAPKDTC